MALQARSRDECGLRSSTRPNQVPGRGGTQRGRKSGCGASVSKMQVCTCLYTFHHRPSTLQIHMTVIPNINHRRKLATSQHLIPHTPKPTTTNDHHTPISSSSPPPSPPQCAHLFLDPLSWMRPELDKAALSGRLECPKCATNVGKYAWQGMRCSCGEWIVPGISLARGRVDEVRSRTTMGRGPGAERGGGNL